MEPTTHITDGVSLLIRERMKELPGSKADGSMSVADLIRKTGLPVATAHAYVKGQIAAARLTPAVRDKLARIAKALELTPEQLIAVARSGEPDHEAHLLYLFRQLRTDTERRRAIMMMQQWVGAGRRRA